MGTRQRNKDHPLLLEALEPRVLLSLVSKLPVHPRFLRHVAASAHSTLMMASAKHGAKPNATSPGGLNAFSPTDIRNAYGMNLVTFGNTPGDGSGQTIAIIVAYDYPTALTDVNTFSTQYGLPLFNQSGTGPTFQRVAQDGSQNFPGTDPAGAGNSNGTWEREAALDIQWAHVMAPQANIILVEAVNDATYPNYPLIENAVDWVRRQAGVSVISMSFSNAESSFVDLNMNQYLTTPSGHAGVTFVAASGDSGTPAGFPAYSLNVVAVGGTSLTLSGGQYLSETAWNKSGGGISVYESKPWYQVNVTQSATLRTAPDIALDGDPNTGVAICDSWDYGTNNSWIKIGGTSLSAPLFAGMMAVVNQGRTLYGLGTLDGFSQTLPALYNAPAADFHDITTGSNGTYSAGTGYDLVTGRGTPVANLLIRDLVGVVGSINGTVYQDNNASVANDAGDAPLAGVQVYVDANSNGVRDIGGIQTQDTGTISLTIPDNNTAGVTSTLTVAGLSGPVTDVNVTLSITHLYDRQLSAYLIGPDGSQITLVSKLGGFSPNYSDTTFDDQAATSITLGSAPYSGSYVPVWLLAAFSGKNANGNWKLKVTDTNASTTGTLINWSLTVTTGSELSTVSASDGTYSLGPLAPGSQTVREILPPLPDHQTIGPTSQTYNLTANISGADFGQVLTTFNATASGDAFYIWVDQGKTAIGKSAGPVNPLYHLPASLVPTINLTTSSSTLVVDFVNGSPLPAGGMQVNGNGLVDSQVRVLGAGAALALSDTQIGPSSGGVLNFTSLGTLDLWNSVVDYRGNLTTLQNLIVDQGTVLYWN